MIKLKLNNKIFICALLALILLLFIGATSASDTLEDDLATNATGDELISVSEAEDALSEGNTIIVDGGGDGKISAAVSSANGGDTIYIKNGEYTESNTITISNSLAAGATASFTTTADIASITGWYNSGADFTLVVLGLIDRVTTAETTIGNLKSDIGIVEDTDTATHTISEG